MKHLYNLNFDTNFNIINKLISSKRQNKHPCQVDNNYLFILWIESSSKLNFGSFCRYRLQSEYGNSIEFSELWDRLQNEGRCCGIIGPQVNYERGKLNLVLFGCNIFVYIYAKLCIQLNKSFNFRPKTIYRSTLFTYNTMLTMDVLKYAMKVWQKLKFFFLFINRISQRQQIDHIQHRVVHPILRNKYR